MAKEIYSTYTDEAYDALYHSSVTDAYYEAILERWENRRNMAKDREGFYEGLLRAAKRAEDSNIPAMLNNARTHSFIVQKLEEIVSTKRKKKLDEERDRYDLLSKRFIYRYRWTPWILSALALIVACFSAFYTAQKYFLDSGEANKKDSLLRVRGTPPTVVTPSSAPTASIPTSTVH